MKTPKYAAVAIILALLVGCAITPVPPARQYRAQTQPQPKPDAALVYFFNETHAQPGLFSGVMLGRPYSILEGGQNGREIAHLGMSCVMCDNQTYTWIYLPTGQHTFTATFRDHRGNGISFVAALEAAHTYYFRVVQHPAAWSPDITIEQVAAEDALREMQTYMDCHEASSGC